MSTKVSKRLEQQVRDAITEVVSRIGKSALHISAITGSKDVFEVCERLTDDEFFAVAKIPKAPWLALVKHQNDEWKSLVQCLFEVALEKQTNDAAAILGLS